MKIQHVPVEWVPSVWPRVAAFIEAGVAYSQGDYTVEHMQAFVTSGQQLLLVAVADDNTLAGAMTVQFFNRPTARVAFITSVGGTGILTRDTLAQLKAILAGFGATALEAAARPSVTRLLGRLGFAPKYMTIGVKL